MASKTDGSYRLCVDCRKLDCITIFDGEPRPSMVDIFSGLTSDNIFSKFDLSKGFWQIPIREEDRKKTAFVTQDGVYQFRKMPFGAINSTATFNRLMRKAYGHISNIDSFVDDVLVHTKDWDHHLEVFDHSLGSVGYYRNFIPNFSMIVAPLSDLTRKYLPTNLPCKGKRQ